MWRRRDAECCENTSSFIFIRRKLQKECSGVVSWTRSYLPCSMKMQQILSWTQLPPILFSLSLQNFPHSNQNSWGPEQVILEPSTVFFSFFRRNITAQGRETVPKRMNFGKIQNGLWPPPPHFWKILLQFYFKFHAQNAPFKGLKSAV